MRQFGWSECPAVVQTLSKKRCISSSRSSLMWTVLNMILAAIMYVEMTHQLVVGRFNLVHPLVYYIVRGLAVLFTINMLVDFMRYIFLGLSSPVVELSQEQKSLLGVCEGEAGFRTATPHSSPRSQSGSPGVSPVLTGGDQRPLQISPSMFGGCVNSMSSLPSSSYQTAAGGGSPMSAYSMGSPCGSVASSMLHTSALFGHSAYSSFSRSGTWSPATSSNTTSPLFKDNNCSPRLRSRVNSPHDKSLNMKDDDCITDVKALSQYLSERETSENHTQLGSAESPPNSSSSFWTFNRSLSDFPLGLRKYRYQVGCRSPQSSKSKDEDNDDPTIYQADEVWQRLGVHPDTVDLWVEKLRKWLRQTILTRLVEEITAVNETLVHIGSEDMQIGETSLSSLKQLAVLKGQHLPTLSAIIPFLEITANQEYLVRRIKELNSGGCLSSFKWFAGDEYKGKPWAEHLPTDSALIMHLLCSYLDSRLPPHPKYPDGKTFSCEHLMKAPDKPPACKTDKLYIYECRVNPPHYKVIIGDDTWNLMQGRNNMFHAILLFLHHIKTKECGMLGRVNLGMSGINILWVLEAN